MAHRGVRPEVWYESRPTFIHAQPDVHPVANVNVVSSNLMGNMISYL
jgi:hypothetical protein